MKLSAWIMFSLHTTRQKNNFIIVCYYASLARCRLYAKHLGTWIQYIIHIFKSVQFLATEPASMIILWLVSPARMLLLQKTIVRYTVLATNG